MVSEWKKGISYDIIMFTRPNYIKEIPMNISISQNFKNVLIEKLLFLLLKKLIITLKIVLKEILDIVLINQMFQELL